MTAPFGLPAELVELQDDYDVLGELGRGGAAVVYRARDRALGREVAIKVVHPRPTSPSDDPVARLAREARTVAQLQHPNIVAVYAVRRLYGGGLALIMQLVPGTTLKSVVQRGGPLPPERTEAIVRDVAAALAYAHARGLVHRDVKPENIFLDERSGRALLADFGIARSTGSDSMTMTGTALGTPFYLSPEQVDGGVVDGRSDLYSLGLVAWEALTGRRPWDGESLYSVIYKQKFEDLPPIEALRPGVPRRLQYLVERMIQKRPGARWAGPEGLLAQLDHPILPADYARWQKVLPDRVTAYREAVTRAAERATSERAATGVVDPYASASTMQFARDATPSASGPVLAPPEKGSGLSAREPWVPAPVSGDDDALLPQPGRTVDLRRAPTTSSAGDTDRAVAFAPAYGDVVEPNWDAPNSLTQPRAPATSRWRRGPTVAIVIAGLALAGVAVAYPRRVVSRTRPSVADTAPSEQGRRPHGLPSPVGVGGARGAAGSPGAPEVLTAGGRHTCTITTASRSYCWGANERGQLGDGGPPAERRVPVAVAAVLDFTAISSGFAHTCALTRLGDVYCWGANSRGQLGDATTVRRNAPVRVAGSAEFAILSSGAAHSCAASADGAVRCWGANDQGQLGDGTRVGRVVPTVVRLDDAVANIAAGGQHTCAATTAGQVYCWGANTDGQLGLHGPSEGNLTPRRVTLGDTAVAVTAGLSHTCALTKAGMVWCWGRNDSGQLGDGTRTSRSEPFHVRIGAGRPVAAIVTGAAHTCALETSGVLWCWGRNARGALGDGSVINRAVPIPVRLPAPAVTVTAGTAHTCATTVAEVTLCWGDNLDGQLGDGTILSRPTPGAVRYPSGVVPRTESISITASTP